MVSLQDVKQIATWETVRFVSGITWWLLPFLIWIKIYLLVGASFFFAPELFSLIGGAFLIVSIIISFSIFRGAFKFEKKVKNRIEYARKFFEDPANETYEKEFRQETIPKLIPYVYSPKFMTLSLPRLPHKFFLFSVLFNLFCSYSIMVLLLSNQNFLSAALSPFLLLHPIIPQFKGFLIQNLGILIAPLFLFSLYFNPVVLATRKKLVRFSKFDLTVNVVGGAFSVNTRFPVLIGYLVDIPHELSDKKNYVMYVPFLFPRDVRRIVQHSFNRVEGKVCRILEFSLKVENERDVGYLKKIIVEDMEVPSILKMNIKSVDPKDSLESMKTMEPTVFIGIVENRCALLGTIRYDAVRQSRIARFYFDSKDVKKEFELISERVISEGREIIAREGIPQVLKPLAEKYEPALEEGSNETGD